MGEFIWEFVKVAGTVILGIFGVYVVCRIGASGFFRSYFDEKKRFESNVFTPLKRRD